MVTSEHQGRGIAPAGRRLGPLLLLLPVLLAACHRGPAPGLSASPSSGALSASQAAAAGFLTPEAPYDSIGPCQRVRDRRIPTGSGCAFLVQGDLDGDRRPDTVFTYASLGPDARATSWHVKTVLASGQASTVEVPEPYQLEVLATADLNGDGRQEALVRVDQGASTSFLEIFMLDVRKHLVPVTEDGRAPLRFGLNGSVTHGDGGSCETGADGKARLVIRSLEHMDEGLPYQTVEKTYVWDGTTVHLAGTRTASIEAAAATAAPDGWQTIQRFYQFTCGPLLLG